MLKGPMPRRIEDSHVDRRTAKQDVCSWRQLKQRRQPSRIIISCNSGKHGRRRTWVAAMSLDTPTRRARNSQASLFSAHLLVARTCRAKPRQVETEYQTSASQKRLSKMRQHTLRALPCLSGQSKHGSPQVLFFTAKTAGVTALRLDPVSGPQPQTLPVKAR